MSWQPALTTGWLAVASVIPLAIVALYFLKLRRHAVLVPSTLLWRRSLVDDQVNSLWQRLRRSILLMLQLIVAGLLILALWRPTMDARQTGRRIILLIDQSASMSAVDVAPNRLAEAKTRAKALIDQMAGGDAAMVIAFCDAARVVCSYSGHAATLKQAIESIEATSRPTDIREALAIASGLANPQKAGEEDAGAVPATLYLFSDGRFAAPTDLSLGNLDLQYIAMGTSGRNLSIASLAARVNELRPQETVLLARIQNHHDQKLSGAAELSVNGKLTDVQRVEIDAGSEQSLLFRLASVESAVASVRVDVQDDLALDNHAWTVINPPRVARVLVIGPPNPLLRSVLSTPSLARRATVEFADAVKADAELADDPSMSRYDLVIFDRTSPRSMPPVHSLFLGDVPPSLRAVERTSVAAPSILNWKSSHPLLRFLTLDDVNVSKAFTVPLPAGADELIESDHGPIAFTVPRGIYTDTVLTFPLLNTDGQWQTDWPLRLSFPLFFMNLLRQAAGDGTKDLDQVTPGAPVSLRGESANVAVVTPSGVKTPVARDSRGTFVFHGTNEVGVYTVEGGATPSRFAVNLFDEEESTILPATKVSIGAVQASDASGEMAIKRDYWRPLALGALVLILMEWYVYHRRVVL